MKQYVLDQLRESDCDDIEEFLKKNAEPTVFSEVFRVRLPEELYTDVQKEHSECYPFYFAVNLSHGKVAFELLIRSQQIIRCSCIRYADTKQREYILNYADQMLDELNIRI